MPSDGFKTLTLPAKTMRLVEQIKNLLGRDEYGKPFTKPKALHFVLLKEIKRTKRQRSHDHARSR